MLNINKNEHKYIVVDEPKNGFGGDDSQDVYDSLDEANKAAELISPLLKSASVISMLGSSVRKISTSGRLMRTRARLIGRRSIASATMTRCSIQIASRTMTTRTTSKSHRTTDCRGRRLNRPESNCYDVPKAI